MSYELHFMSYELHFMSYIPRLHFRPKVKLQVARCGLQMGVHDAGCRLGGGGCRMRLQDADAGCL